MKTYLVGGAVRDKLLNYPFHERDWVVVGATPQQLTELGFKPVGKDFPVFLHPDTQEEYALARTERKTGKGYKGFQFHTSTEVTLEEDLRRRDLTINAIAMDENDTIVDPYGGEDDLRNKILRHVADNFAEDPVRILRVARFAARYHHLEFVIADETMSLMSDMVENGEVDHLVNERVWKEMERALGEANPQVFFSVLRRCGALARLIPELENLFGVPQPPQHHPEIDCGIHSLMALQQASILSKNTRVRFASLLHDLGKATTPADILPSHHGHELRGIALVKNLCARLGVPNEYRELTQQVSEFHTHCHRVFELKPSTLVATLEKLDAFRRPERFAEFLLCCEADARGRTGFENRDYKQAAHFQTALNVCTSVSATEVDSQQFSGPAFGQELHRLRIAKLKASQIQT